MDFEDETGGSPPLPLFHEGDGASDAHGVLTGTPAFEALFAALEHTPPLADLTSLGLLLGSSTSSFG